jgi:hypothetical protein
VPALAGRSVFPGAVVVLPTEDGLAGLLMPGAARTSPLGPVGPRAPVGAAFVSAEVVAEGTFGFPPPGAHDAFDDDFGFRRNLEIHGLGPHHGHGTVGKESGEGDLVGVFGKGENPGEPEQGIPQNDRDFERLVQRFGFTVVEPSAFLDLPVESELAGSMFLEAVDAQVPRPGLGVAGEHEAGRDERSSVERPAGEDGKIVEVNGAAFEADFLHGSG